MDTAAIANMQTNKTTSGPKKIVYFYVTFQR